MNNSYLKLYTPTWSHNRVRINNFKDSRSIWFPFPTAKREGVDFLTLLNNEDAHRSVWRDFDGGRYKFASYELFLDVNVNYITREYDTLLTLISYIGSIKTGLMLIFGICISSWQSHKHDQKLASTLLLEKEKTKLKDNKSKEHPSMQL